MSRGRFSGRETALNVLASKIKSNTAPLTALTVGGWADGTHLGHTFFSNLKKLELRRATAEQLWRNLLNF